MADLSSKSLTQNVTGAAVEACSTLPERCLHCGLSISDPRRPHGAFCCAGCSGAYALIHDLGLDDYYAFRERVAETSAPVVPTGDSEYYDDAKFLEEYTTLDSDGFRIVNLFLEGIHCAACIWLLESLPKAVVGVRYSTVDFTRQLIRLSYSPESVKLSSIARTIARLGYSPHPVRPNTSAVVRSGSSRDMPLRIGLAAVSAGNTMMFAVDLYQGWFSGMEVQYANFMRWLSFVVALPAVLWSAQPFYRAALLGIKTRTLHIDIPISLALILAFIVSIVHTVQGDAHVYYDTITMLIFLLLGARWLQQQGLAKAHEGAGLLSALLPLHAVRLRGEEKESVYVDSIVPGDLLLLEADTVIPADAEVIWGEGEVSTASLTGESAPLRVGIGEIVFAGTKNLASQLRVRVLRTARDSRLGQLISQVESAPTTKPPIVELTDRISGVFVTVVLLLSIATFGGWFLYSGFSLALQNTLAVLVITCPCAVGLAAPVTMTVALKRAATQGLFIKGAEIIERLSQTEVLFLDKTGTVTDGYLTIKRCWIAESGTFTRLGAGDDPRLTAIAADVLRLESESRHPARGALERFFAGRAKASDLPEVRQILGCGIEGRRSSGGAIRLGSLAWFRSLGGELPAPLLGELQEQLLSPIVLWEEDGVRCVFGCGDRIREGMKEFSTWCHRRRMEVFLLSGDDQRIVTTVGGQLGLDTAHSLGEKHPEQKVALVSASTKDRHTTMVGDGANDAAALRAAGCGIALTGGAEVALRASDAYLVEASGGALELLFAGSLQTMRLIRTNLAVSLAYNIVGASLAITGYVNPLVAAILMPVSSLTVVAIALRGISFPQKLER